MMRELHLKSTREFKGVLTNLKEEEGHTQKEGIISWGTR